MARMTSYDDLLPLMLVDMPGYEEKVAKAALRHVGREFCIRTEAFREELPPLPIVDWQRDYDITNFSYDAEIHRLRWVMVNTNPVDLGCIELRKERTLRFHTNEVPHDRDDRLLVCGTCSKTAAADWTGITDGAVTLSISGATYALSSLNFSGASSMDDVALVIQTALRASMENNIGYVEWDAVNTRFLVWTDQADVSYLTAGASGTDVSGAAYMNGLTGGTGVLLAAHLRVEVIFRPHLHTDVLPDWFLDRHGATLAAGALAYLCGQKNRPWSSPSVYELKNRDYLTGLDNALIENDREQREYTEGPRP